MNYLKTFMDFWRKIIIRYLLVIVWILVAFHFWGWVPALFLLVIEAFFEIKWWHDLKAKLMKSLPGEFSCLPSHVEEYEALNLNLLTEYTDAFKALGFEHIVDFKLDQPSPGWGRLLSHPEYYCFAEIFQVFPVKKDPMPMRYGAQSYFEDDWLLGTGTSKPNGMTYMWRNPKHLGTYCAEGEPAEVFSIHLERRQEVQARLGLQLSTDISWEFYFTKQTENALKRREIFERKNVLVALIEGTLFELNPVTEWLGDRSPQKTSRNKSSSLN